MKPENTIPKVLEGIHWELLIQRSQNKYLSMVTINQVYILTKRNKFLLDFWPIAKAAFSKNINSKKMSRMLIPSNAEATFAQGTRMKNRIKDF